MIPLLLAAMAVVVALELVLGSSPSTFAAETGLDLPEEPAVRLGGGDAWGILPPLVLVGCGVLMLFSSALWGLALTVAGCCLLARRRLRG